MVKPLANKLLHLLHIARSDWRDAADSIGRGHPTDMFIKPTGLRHENTTCVVGIYVRGVALNG